MQYYGVCAHCRGAIICVCQCKPVQGVGCVPFTTFSLGLKSNTWQVRKVNFRHLCCDAHCSCVVNIDDFVSILLHNFLEITSASYFPIRICM